MELHRLPRTDRSSHHASALPVSRCRHCSIRHGCATISRTELQVRGYFGRCALFNAFWRTLTLFRAMYDSKSLPNMDENLRAFELIFEGIFMSLFFVYRIFPFRYDYPFAGKIVLSFGEYAIRTRNLTYLWERSVFQGFYIIIIGFGICIIIWTAF